ncbi:MAG: hypothetical protein PUD67_09495 [Prevotellaceae bacterium]|nr:hypothetical protein [Prevotellaceae bacterium]
MKRLMIGKALIMTSACAAMLVSCNRTTDFYDPYHDANEYSSNWKDIVGEVDANQTWNTSVPVKIKATANEDGIIRVTTDNPIGGKTVSLFSQTVSKGETIDFTVAAPQNAEKLYVSLYDNQGYVREQNFVPNGDINIVNFTTTEQIAAAKAPARIIASTWTFASDDDSRYPNVVPTGAIDIAQWGQHPNYPKTGDFYVPTTTTGINAWGSENYYIYFDKGTYNITGNVSINYATIILLPGAVVNITNPNIGANSKVIVSEGATFNSPSLNMGGEIFNRGEVTINSINMYNAGIIYNRGTLKVNDIIYLNNYNTQVINEGNLNAKNLRVQGNSHFYNIGTTVIEEETRIDCNDPTWRNDGQYTTGTYHLSSGAKDIINNCHLSVKGTTYLVSEGHFKMDANSSLETKNLEVQHTMVYLGEHSIIKVSNEAKMYSSVSDKGYIESVAQDAAKPAVFTAKSVVSGCYNANQGYVINYKGNLVVAADSHFDNGYSDSYHKQQPYINIIGNVKFAQSATSADVSIPKSACSCGYNGDEPTVIPQQYYYYAFEDLGTTNDFDFNDVVLRVSAPVDGKSDIQLCAAGGTLPASVNLDGAVICSDVHDAFGVDVKTMVNTGAEPTLPFVNISTDVEIGEGQDASSLPLSITVYGNNSNDIRTISVPNIGNVPLMIRVAGNDTGKWFWSREKVNISDSYPDFGAWGANYNSNANWYLNFVEGRVTKY